MLTVTAGVIELPAATLAGCTVNASFAGDPMVVSVFPDVVQPAKKRSDRRAEFPRILQATRAVNREGLDIAVFPFHAGRSALSELGEELAGRACKMRNLRVITTLTRQKYRSSKAISQGSSLWIHLSVANSLSCFHECKGLLITNHLILNRRMKPRIGR
jgi:hypothetical protein